MLEPKKLDIFANILQVVTFLEVFAEANNNDILQELQHQNETYLQKIINQNEEILLNLKGVKSKCTND